MDTNKRIIGLDPGNEITGMVVLDGGIIIGAWNLPNTDLFNKIGSYSLHKNLTIVIEDIKPYSLKLTPQVIDTCKFIGEAVFRLRINAGLHVEMVSRYEVKKWVFDTYPQICLPLISDKIDKKMYEACSVETQEEIKVDRRGRSKRKSSFIYVDDRIVIEVMKAAYGLKMPPKGKGYEYGLKTHSFQALGLATCFSMTRR